MRVRLWGVVPACVGPLGPPLVGFWGPAGSPSGGFGVPSWAPAVGFGGPPGPPMLVLGGPAPAALPGDRWFLSARIGAASCCWRRCASKDTRAPPGPLVLHMTVGVVCTHLAVLLTPLLPPHARVAFCKLVPLNGSWCRVGNFWFWVVLPCPHFAACLAPPLLLFGTCLHCELRVRLMWGVVPVHGQGD